MKHDDDAPELTGRVIKAARRGRDVLPDSVLSQFKRAPGRPVAETPKVPVSIRLDSDVVAHFKATGSGWQTRINGILREAATAKPVKTDVKRKA